LITFGRKSEGTQLSDTFASLDSGLAWENWRGAAVRRSEIESNIFEDSGDGRLGLWEVI
jgi:hypothetical protein